MHLFHYYIPISAGNLGDLHSIASGWWPLPQQTNGFGKIQKAEQQKQPTMLLNICVDGELANISEVF